MARRPHSSECRECAECRFDPEYLHKLHRSEDSTATGGAVRTGRARDMIYFCCDDRRREAVRRHNTPPINGIDYLEVDQDEVTLYVHFIKPMTGTTLTPAN